MAYKDANCTALVDQGKQRGAPITRKVRAQTTPTKPK